MITTLAVFDFLHIGPYGLLASLVLGLIIGAIAKLLMPGKDPGGCIITSLIGIAGAGIGSTIGNAIFNSQGYGGFILAVLGAMLLLFLYRLFVAKKG